MSETRTGPQKRKLVEAMQGDLQEFADDVAKILARIQALEEDSRGVNGLPTRCKAWANALTQMAADMREEAEDVERKLLGKGPKIESTVDATLSASVGEAKAMAGD